MTTILASSLNMYHLDENGELIIDSFGNRNSILKTLKSEVKKRDKFLFVASDDENFEKTDYYASPVFKFFDKILPFKSYEILDLRTKSNAEKLVVEADLIYLAGGHVPTQNKFFEQINLKSLIKKSNCVVLGISAGSMNCADIVYSQPEDEGESIDPKYKRYLKGLGLTKLSILPHFSLNDYELDGKSVLNNLSLPDSKKHSFVAIKDDSYVVDNGEKQIVFGESFLFQNGKYSKICKEDDSRDITKMIVKMQRKNKDDLVY